jgi:hypothetical protein
MSRPARLALWLAAGLVAVPAAAPGATGQGQGATHASRASLDAATSVGSFPPAVAASRQFLETLEIDDSQLAFLQDGRPVVSDEEETLYRLLYRLPVFALGDVERWSVANGDWQGVLKAPEACRSGFFYLEGVVVGVSARAVLPEVARRLGFADYYQVLLSANGRTVRVFARRVPQAWKEALASGTEVRDGASCHGMFLKLGPVVEGQQQAVFATSSMAWHPRRPLPALGTERDHVWLGRLGMDVGLLEHVQHHAAMGDADRECFYQLLAAVGRGDAAALRGRGRSGFRIAQLIRQPEQVAGRRYCLNGTVRRCLRVPVPDADIRARFGIDHYYEVTLFVPLARRVQFVLPDSAEVAGGGKSPAKVFSEYPFVFCVRELPAGVPVGEDVHQLAEICGFFLKTWAYETAYMSGGTPPGQPRQLQVSPLLVGRTLVPLADSSPLPRWVAPVVVLGFLAVLLSISLAVWRTARADRRFWQRFVRLQSPCPPDFSALDVDNRTDAADQGEPT